MNASKQQESIFPVGTRIRFTKTLTCAATGDHPDFLYAQAGDEGEITGHGTKEGYWAKTTYNPPFGVSRDEFEPIELSKQQESEQPRLYLVIGSEDGIQSSIWPENKLHRAVLSLLFENPDDCSQEEAEFWETALRCDANWRSHGGVREHFSHDVGEVAHIDIWLITDPPATPATPATPSADTPVEALQKWRESIPEQLRDNQSTPSADEEIERIAERYVSQGCYAQVSEALKIYHRSHANDREALEAKTHEALKQLTKAPELPKEYMEELARCDSDIQWCKDNGNDWYGVNFHQGKRSGIIFGQIVQSEEIRKLKATLAAREGEIERIRGQLLSHERMAAAGVYVETEKYSGMVVQISTLQAELADYKERFNKEQTHRIRVEQRLEDYEKDRGHHLQEEQHLKAELATAQAALSRAQAARSSNADDRDAALNERDSLRSQLTEAQAKLKRIEEAAAEWDGGGAGSACRSLIRVKSALGGSK